MIKQKYIVIGILENTSKKGAQSELSEYSALEKQSSVDHVALVALGSKQSFNYVPSFVASGQYLSFL
jgi:precorrin-3B methylase